MTKSISAEFPFQSNYISVLGSKMHYIDEGEGDPILFLHGNPTSSYLWRNIIPYVTSHGRAIAPDLIGMGKSDKPELAYRYHDHYKYLEEFINALNLTNITLVLHDWGSGLGFNFAARNPERIKAIAFMEALVRPRAWSDFPPDFRFGFRLMRTPGIGWMMISVGNAFITQMLPKAIVRELSSEEKVYYGKPYQTISSRKPLRQWPVEVPIDGKPADVHEIITNYSQWLQTTDIPKLMFYASPGAIIDPETVVWVQNNFSNLTSFDMGPGIHFVQEDNPHFIGEKLADWYTQLESTVQSAVTVAA
ncbi:MAG: haloalkane dehalogenase [Chloroflexota bacterium]